MKIKSNSDGSKWLEIKKNLLLFKPYNRTQVICWKAKGKLKFCNFRFKIYKFRKEERMSPRNLRCFIRLPFFYWHKHNGGWEIGLPNLYLWYIDSRPIPAPKKVKYIKGD